MATYDEVSEHFEWRQAWDHFDGDETSFNLGYEMIGKHADTDGPAVRIANFDDGSVDNMSYTELYEQSNQFASYLGELGLERGSTVAGMMEPRPELYATMAGTWLSGNVYVPLFTLFGPEAVNYRIEDADVEVLVTTAEHAEKLDDELAAAIEVVVVDDDVETSFDTIRTYPTDFDSVETHSQDTAILQYTSGTTGQPKGVELNHAGVVSLYPYIEYAADIRPEDTYFGGAPPAWSYGLMVCTVYPLHLGIGTFTYRSEFNPIHWVDVLQDYSVTNLFAPATAFRKLAQLDLGLENREFDVRHVYCAGGAVDSNTVEWGEKVFGVKIQDHYGFTEGGILLANYAFDDWEIRPGSMGKPIPGVDVELLDLNKDEPVRPGETGEIAFRKDSIPMFNASYYGLPEKTEEKFGGKWIRSDDLAEKDEDGYYWYKGRADDVIISSGYRIGPAEVEESVLEHESVNEVGVVGLPDEERGERVAAFVVLKLTASPSDELAEEIKEHVKQELSKHEYPRQVEFLEELPKTESGKVQRYKLREEYA